MVYFSTIQDMLLESLYAVNKPERNRTAERPMSVICCGMPRTGTDSLSRALSILGYNDVYHGSLLPSRPGDCMAWVEAAKLRAHDDARLRTAAFWDKIFGDYMAITDLPGAAFIAEFVQVYPEAKIVLNLRNVDSWKISMRRALGFYLQGRRYFELFDFNAYWMRRYIETNNDPIYSGDFEANAEAAYEAHCELVRQIVPRDRLLEWHVEDGWEPLCRHLGNPVPNQHFPQGNSTSDIVPRLEAKTRALKRKSWQRISMGLALVIGVLTIFYKQA